MINSLYTLYTDYIRRLSDRHALLAMSDRELSDIGISRSMIGHVTRTSSVAEGSKMDAVRHSFGFAQVFSGR